MDFIYRGRLIREVGFFGLGESTKGIYSYLKKRYPSLRFVLRDERSRKSDFEFDRVYFGSGAFDDIREDALFLSPSVRRDRQEFAKARDGGIIISSDCELFFENTKADVLAITGSDGKSTTTAITSLLLSVDAIGNIGNAMTSHLGEHETKRVICELSSFQLFDTEPKTRRAYITNIRPNHLNWHKSFSEYVSAKENILKRTDEPIFNYDCEVSRELSKKYSPFAVVSMRLPYADLKSKIKAELYITKEDGDISLSGERLLPVDRIRLGGEYNLYNFSGAIALSHGYCQDDDIFRVARDFRGLEHRYTQVHTASGVRYIDSSIDSTPTRTIATLSRTTEDTILILGGRSKNLSYTPLADAIPKNVVSIIAVGENSSEIETAFRESKTFCKKGIPFIRISDFCLGVEYAVKNARPGQTVLLSPASTSFDLFESYIHRAEEFARIVKKITQ